MVKLGPVMPELHGEWLAPAVGHGLGNGQRGTPVAAQLVHLDESRRLRTLAAHAGPVTMAAVSRSSGVTDCRRRPRPRARRLRRTARKAVHEVGAAVVEVGLML